jgi:putative lipoic acid-binding regulatory protein
MTLGNPPEQIIKFPCPFPVTVMGLNNEAFKAAALDILKKHLRTEVADHTSRLSSGGKYLSLSITFIAENRAQVDALYHELNDHDLVVMTL